MDLIMNKRRIKRILIACALMMLICSFISSYVKTSFGKVLTKNLIIENSYGSLIDITLYKPNNASAFNYVPAIFVMPGENEDKEDLVSFCIELSRRGFVVAGVNESGQGNSMAADGDLNPHFLYDAIKYVNNLTYVDSGKIAIVAYTNVGAKRLNEVIELDDINSAQMVSCVLFIAGDAKYKNEKNEYFNYYGDRHVGIISVKYDDLSHNILSESGNKVEKFSTDFISGIDALSFTSLGRDPGSLVSGIGDNLNRILWFGSYGPGTGTSRAIFQDKCYRANIYDNKNIIKYACEFLTKSFSIVSNIQPNSQIWVYKFIADIISFIAFITFLVVLTIGLCKTGYFCDVSLLNEGSGEFETEHISAIGKKNHYFLLLIAYFLFATLSYFKMASLSNLEFIGQKQPTAISLWLLACGIFVIVIYFIWYYSFAKKNEYNMTRLGLIVPRIVIFKTLFLVFLISLMGCFMIIAFKYFFNIDFRLGSFVLSTLSLERLIYSFFPLLLVNSVYFVSMSIFQNTILYNNTARKFNDLFVALFISLPAFIIPAAQVLVFMYTKKPLFFSLRVPYGDYVVWLVPIQFVFIITSFISRYVFRRTRNIYLPALLNTVWFTAMIVANTRLI